MPSQPSRRGVTLVEAVAGTAILGSLLVSILIGASRFQAQAGRAERRLEACRAADGLLETWWAKREEFPRSAQGAVPGRDGWSWRTRVVESEEARALGGEVVALEVFGPAGGAGEAAVRVELVVAVKDEEERDETQARADAR
ncbi:MAG: type II secretion system protein [Planctomycetes bacterium]|nr:type II secretion system protein [Planctomycetota bacterium]